MAIRVAVGWGDVKREEEKGRRREREKGGRGERGKL